MSNETKAVGLVLSLLTCLAIGACGGSPLDTHSGGQAPPAPSLAELQDALRLEFERLGVDPDKAPAEVSQGEENMVFDLSAFVVDPDGTGPNPPTEVRLAWTERTVGDYDQNGEVSISDLTPLGGYFTMQVAYDNPAYHQGFPHWPSGSPLDDGGAGAGSPPAPGSGAENWRLARVDGDFNGELNISDITPIATHWAQRLDGYRVYRITPADVGFVQLPNADNPALAYTIARPAIATGHPARYEFVDSQLGPSPSGWYEYYVVPYSDVDTAEGPPSNFVGANLDSGGGGGHLPVAILNADVLFGHVPLTVTFDLAASYDPDGTIAAYEWDMDQTPSTFEWNSYPDPTTQITYHTPGVKDQWARVGDNDFNVAATHLKIAVADPGGNLPPIAHLTVHPPGGGVPLDATWDASASLDHDGTIVKYEWDTDQTPGTFEYDSGTDPAFALTYNSGGQKQQWVRITDDGGATDVTSATLMLEGTSGNQPPVASFTASPASGSAPLVVNFDATGSFDPDGSITQYEWDYEGAGLWTTPSGSATSQYIYSTQGSFAADLRVTDNGGAMSTFAVPVTVYPTGSSNQPPTAAMTHFPITGPAPLQVLFDAGGSTDSDGTIVNYGWDFDTDGTIDLNTSSGSAANTYTAVNVWQATLTVTDDQGATDGVFVFTDVTGPGGPNNPPVAAFTATPSSGAHPLTVNFDASSSTDSDGTINNYSWDFDGDGMVNEHTTIPTTSYVYHQPGTYATNVRVLDDDGATDTAYVTVTVSPGGAYWRNYQVEPSWGDYMQCSMAVVVGNPAIAYSDRNSERIRYVRATDSKGTAWASRVDIADAGMWCQEVSLAVVNGRPAVAYERSVNAYYGELKFDRADDGLGSAWTGSMLVDGTGADHCHLAVVNGYPIIMYNNTKGFQYVHALDAIGTGWMTPVSPFTYGGWYPDLVMVEGHPGICHYLHGQQLIYQRSTDVDGLDWSPGPDSPGQVVDQYGGQYCSIALAGGRPAMAYYTYWGGTEALKFIRALDKYGNQWDAPEILDGSVSGVGTYCDMEVANGIPYVVYRDEGGPCGTYRLRCIIASDAACTTWGSPETVKETWVGWIDAETVNGYPAVAWCGSTSMEYAIRY